MGTAIFDHPWLGGLVSDPETEALLGPEAEIAAMIDFERALAAAEAACGVIPAAAASRIGAALEGFRPDLAALRSATARDGVVVPDLVRQLRAAAGENGASLHFGATSQDVIDTALILRLKPLVGLWRSRLRALDHALGILAERFGDKRLMGRTRMQAAIPITAGDRIAAWRGPLPRHLARLDALERDLLVLQFGGAAGTLEKLGPQAGAVRAALADRLGLGDAPQWHSQRDRIAALADWLALVAGTLGKLGQDVALMAQGGEIRLSGGGKSSAMAHKQNPVAAESLVALARFTAVQVGGLHQAMIHEQERSGGAWTLEWLLLPPTLLATGAALVTAQTLVGAVTEIG
ncbi:MAG: 3-carboxy-cis,cis-muconate cycloisomerase [Amaricoccus sp.]